MDPHGHDLNALKIMLKLQNAPESLRQPCYRAAPCSNCQMAGSDRCPSGSSSSLRRDIYQRERSGAAFTPWSRRPSKRFVCVSPALYLFTLHCYCDFARDSSTIQLFFHAEIETRIFELVDVCFTSFSSLLIAFLF